MKKKPLLMALICFACPLLSGLFQAFGLKLTWRFQDAVFLCVALGCLALTVFGKADDSPLNARCSLIMPAFCAAGCLWFLVENIGRLSILPTVVILVCAWRTARPHLPGLGRKLAAAALLVVPAGFAVLVGMIGLFLGDFGAIYVSDAVLSPDGSRAAIAVEVDEGAMGGSARVEICRAGEADLGIAVIGFAPETVWESGWTPLEEIEIVWADDDSLSVNGKLCPLP